MCLAGPKIALHFPYIIGTYAYVYTSNLYIPHSQYDLLFLDGKRAVDRAKCTTIQCCDY